MDIGFIEIHLIRTKNNLHASRQCLLVSAVAPLQRWQRTSAEPIMRNIGSNVNYLVRIIFFPIHYNPLIFLVTHVTQLKSLAGTAIL